jgi:hypothetical protein
MYIKNDQLALGMGGTKAWPNRKILEKFGATACEMVRPGRVVDEVIERAMDYKPADRSSSIWDAVREEMELGVLAIQAAKAPARVRKA